MSTDQPSDADNVPPTDRLNRVEENLAFAEHSVDQLSDEIRVLTKRLHDTIRRLDAIEQRLGKVLEKIEPTQPE